MAKKKDNEVQPADNGNAVVPVGPRGGELQVSRKRFWTSLDLSTEDGKRLYLRCKNGSDMSADDVMGKEFSVVNILVHEVPEVDPETGEERHWVRYCLVTDDDKIISGGSSGIRDSLADLFELYGSPPWKPGVAVRLVQQKTRKGFKIHKLEKV